MTVNFFQLCGRRERLAINFHFLFATSGCSCQFHSRLVSIQFASEITRNNRGMILEMRSYIFRGRSCSRRRRSFLRAAAQYDAN